MQTLAAHSYGAKVHYSIESIPSQNYEIAVVRRTPATLTAINKTIRAD